MLRREQRRERVGDEDKRESRAARNEEVAGR